METNQKIQELLKRIEELSLRQEYFSREIKALTTELYSLKSQIKLEETDYVDNNTEGTVSKKNIQKEPMIRVESPIKALQSKIERSQRKPSDLEKIIGESWINKIGIIILIIGIAIGAKYSIENNLITPITRIILGYISGISLLIIGIRLKVKFENYSAVLVSGAMTIIYFITFFAYNYYLLIPQWLAFVLMLIFTVFTVITALNYNRSVIAHIGLVGAYAVPFLLSDNSGNIVFLLCYILIINTGILAISIKKYWKSLYYTSISLTWIIFSAWLVESFQFSNDKSLALGFSTISFVMFYAVSISNRIRYNQSLNIGDLILIFINSFIYYGIGYYILDHDVTNRYLGLFTLFNSFIHFTIVAIIRTKKLSEQTLQYIVLGLGLTFIITAIPIQLNGSWITLVWLGMSILLFWLTYKKNHYIYERFAKILSLLVFFSLMHDWNGFWDYSRASLLNGTFITSIMVGIGFLYICYLHKKMSLQKVKTSDWHQLFWAIKYLVIVFIFYIAFHQEIVLPFEKLYLSSEIEINNSDETEYTYSIFNHTIIDLKNITSISYSLLFFCTVSFINRIRLESKKFAIVVMIITAFFLLISQSIGLFILGNIRQDYVNQPSESYYNIGLFHILIRYLYFGIVGLGVYSFYAYYQASFMLAFKKSMYSIYIILLNICLLIFLSNELITWLDIAGYRDIYKIALSILWGLYSLVLILLGIYYRKKILRVGAMILFTGTLAKLFLYDIAHLNTISKTIVFISLGILLLVISFLYNKFKDKITDVENVD